LDIARHKKEIIPLTQLSIRLPFHAQEEILFSSGSELLTWFY